MSALPDSESSLRHFRLSAAAEPGLLPRVLELLAKRGLVPAGSQNLAEAAANRPRDALAYARRNLPHAPQPGHPTRLGEKVLSVGEQGPH